MYKEARWDWNVKCLDDKMGIRSQSRSSSCFIAFMKGGQVPDSIKSLSAVISEYFLFFEILRLYGQLVLLEYFPWVLDNILLYSYVQRGYKHFGRTRVNYINFRPEFHYFNLLEFVALK